MQEHSQIILSHAETAEDLILSALFEKVHPQQVTVFFGQLVEDGLNPGAGLTVDQRRVEIDAVIDRIHKRLHFFVAVLSPPELELHVVADGAHKGAKTLGMLDAFPSYRLQDAEQRFLPDVFDQLRGAYAITELQRQQVSEVGSEVRLDFGVAACEPPEIVLVKGMKVQ
jgi:hypothetical protein